MKDVIETIGGYRCDTRSFRMKTFNANVPLWKIEVSVALEHHEDEWDETIEITGYKGDFKDEPVIHAFRKISFSSCEIEVKGERVLEMFEDQIGEMIGRITPGHYLSRVGC